VWRILSCHLTDGLPTEQHGIADRAYFRSVLECIYAENCPAVFNVHVRQFVELIWSVLRDPKLDVRMAAVAALRACLILVEQRETRYRVQWWYNLFEQTMRGVVVCSWMRAAEKVLEANVHASLLTLGELLQHSGEFMLARCATSTACTCLMRFFFFVSVPGMPNGRAAIVVAFLAAGHSEPLAGL
jgi:hypothetical protein